MTLTEKMAIQDELQINNGYTDAMIDVYTYILANNLKTESAERIRLYVLGKIMYGEGYDEGMEGDKDLAKKLPEKKDEVTVSWDTFVRTLDIVGKDLTEINGRLDILEKMLR